MTARERARAAQAALGRRAESVRRQHLQTREGEASIRVLRPEPAAGTRPALAGAGTPPAGPTRPGTVLLGHGAGGQRDAADVIALTGLTDLGWTVALVDQPWRVAGRKIATRPPTLDRAWHDVLGTLAADGLDDQPLPRPWVVGGRSAGARVACRTAVSSEQLAEGGELVQVSGIIALAFPLHPPGKPATSRAAELGAAVDAGIPTLVLQGRRDPFGSPDEVASAVSGPALQLHPMPGTHSPSSDLGLVREHVGTFLTALPSPDHEETL